MRITGGAARGIPITLPPRGDIRPATDSIREAVFSSLGDLPRDARVLDAFAGTGAYGLEAISRGAKSALFVDKNPSAIIAQKKNFAAVVRSMKASGLAIPTADFLRADLLKSVPFPNPLPCVDLIFCDPPWELWRDEQFAKVVEMLASLADRAPHTFQATQSPYGPKWLRHLGRFPARSVATRGERDPLCGEEVKPTQSAWARIVLESPASFVPAVPAGWEVARRLAKKGKDQPAATILRRCLAP